MRGLRILSSIDPVRSTWRVAGAAGSVCGVIMAAAIVIILVRGLNATTGNGVLSRVGSNWLVTLFKLHLRVPTISNELLHGVKLVDMVILALTAVVGVGLWLKLKDAAPVWSLVGLALPVIGIVIFIISRLAGRSAVMAAVLIFSIIALRNTGFGWVVPWIGILAAALLLVGDFTESLHSGAIGVMMAAGYVLLDVWFVAIGIGLVRLE